MTAAYVPPCVGKPTAYDHLIDSDATTPGKRAAAHEAADICQDCQIRVRCLGTENRDQHWAQVVRLELMRRAHQRRALAELEGRQSA